jgi:hypothetical protein
MMSEKFNHLESAIAHKTTATELVINYRETRDLEISKILKLDKLEKLSLRYFPSHYFFPKQIYELKSLKSLTLSECSFGKIPDGISSAKNLKELKLVNCKIDKFTEDILKNSSIESLHIENTDLKNLIDADFFSVSKIKELIFLGSDLTQLHRIIGKLKVLKSIVLKENKLSTIPLSVLKYKKLESLSIVHNCFTTVPDTLAELKNLKRIDFSFNQLNEIDCDFKSLPKLEELDLSYNEFKEFPDRILEIKHLNKLKISYNLFKSLDERGFQQQKLKYLDIDSDFKIYLPLNALDWIEQKSNKLVCFKPLCDMINSIFFKTANYNLKKELAMIHFQHPDLTREFKLKCITQLLKFDFHFTREFAYLHALDNASLNKGDIVYFWDSWSGFKTELTKLAKNKGVKIAKELNDKVDIVIVSPKILDSDALHEIFSGKWRLKTEYSLLISLNEEIPYLINADEDLANGLLAILKSRDSLNQKLGFEMISVGGIPDLIILNLVSTLFYSMQRKELVEKVVKYLKRFAEPGWDIALYKILQVIESKTYYHDRLKFIERYVNPAFLKIRRADLYNYDRHSI